MLLFSWSLQALFKLCQAYILQYTGQRIVFDIRQELFTSSAPGSALFDTNPWGLVTRVTNDTENLHEMYTAVLVNLFKDVFMILASLL